jgi:hypothetical protein
MANEQPIIGPPNTQIYSDGHHLVIRYRGTDLVKINYQEITLTSGGSRSPLVQARLNQSSRQFDLGYHVTAEGGVWMVQVGRDSHEFRDNMRIYRSPGRNHSFVRYEPEPSKEGTS